MHAPSLRSTYNLQPPSVGPGVRQPLLPFGSCSLAPPWLAFEYNTWPSSSDRPGEPKRTVIMLMRGHCCVHRGRPAECRISFFPSLERPPLSPTPPLWREKPRRLFSRVLDAFHRTPWSRKFGLLPRVNPRFYVRFIYSWKESEQGKKRE